MTGISEYLAKIAEINRLDIKSPDGWIFHPGMLFQSTAKWWGDFGSRHAPHEGLDILFYRSADGFVDSIGPDTLVPLLADGYAVNICDDFLGRSLVVESRMQSTSRFRIFSVYAHLDIMPGIETGTRLAKGDMVATPASTAGKKSKIAPHLHLSVLEAPSSIPARELDWNLFGNPDSPVRLVNPAFL
ncbi:MAG: M23 family metallopeptidase [Desulfarculaceae bacterium]|nr:M23 family metallopeptidase [Desulfarculaceae bacterium]